jgi:hypothetical protein
MGSTFPASTLIEARTKRPGYFSAALDRSAISLLAAEDHCGDGELPGVPINFGLRFTVGGPR